MSVAVNEVGKRYGMLTVIERAENDNDRHARYKCICDCGNIVVIRGATLRAGRAQSCGCYMPISVRKRRLGKKSERKDIVGQRFGKLVALKRVENKGGEVMYECLCDCGNKKTVRKWDLLSGDTNSCGCLKSKKEADIALLLQERGINFVREYSFEHLIGKRKRKLRFDFYIPEKNCCIEYNGGQHYKPVEHFGGKDAFLQRQLNDKAKLDFCYNNNIPLLVLNEQNYSEDLILNWIKNN